MEVNNIILNRKTALFGLKEDIIYILLHSAALQKVTVFSSLKMVYYSQITEESLQQKL
jgi:hypothetical protein